MKRIFVILLVIPGIAFGAYTEFYCDAANGSNLNGGSSTATSVYTSTNGNWNGSTSFTPTDGSNPATASPGCSVGDFASVYLDAATIGVFIGRVTAVTNATNGAITISGTSKAGSPPASGATGRTIKCGGLWKGPNGTSNFPLGLSSLSTATDSNGDTFRLNLKNNSSYALTAAINWSQSSIVLQGYSSTPGDFGKALLTNNATSGGVQFQTTGGQSMAYLDIIWESTGGSGTNQVFNLSGTGTKFIRNVFRGGRTEGLATSSSASMTSLYGCEIYGNNLSNTASRGGVTTSVTSGLYFTNCYIHDNTGSNTDGARISAGFAQFNNCVFDSNGASGILNVTGTGGGGADAYNCGFYNNGGDGYKQNAGSVQGFIIIANCIFTKNTGKAINNTQAAQAGLAIKNVYGAGSEANGSSDTLGSIQVVDSITLGSNVSPYAAASTGNFTLTEHTLFNVGYFPFEENDGANTGTVGYPDIGAAQHNDTCGGTGPCQTSGASAQ